MADRSILYRLRAALQGGRVAVAGEIELLQNYPGVVTGTTDVETALQRLDGTGVGAGLQTFSGSFTASAANINTWFGDRQQTRLRCVSSGGISPVIFTLPGTTELTTAFNTLQTAGLPEVIRLIIEYTGPSTALLRVIAQSSPNPQIGGTSAAIVRTGTFATFEITRTSGVISDYVFQDRNVIGGSGGSTLDTIRLISPATEVWDASANGPLPSTGVITGNAYKVVNAPSDGSGRFGEVMQNDDWVIWEGATFTSWSATPLQWFVLPAHDVRRITALEQDFLTDIEITLPVTDRNGTIRGADYADTAGEIRMKIYPNASDYSAADLNTTGQIDQFTSTTNAVGRLGIRLAGQLSSLTTVLPTLWVYADDGSSGFTRLLNLDRDFTHQGDFGVESDYLSDTNISYQANDVLRIYVTTDLDRYSAPNLDITESNLVNAVQGKLNAVHPDSIPETLRAFNNQAELFEITHSDFRSNNQHAYVATSFAFLKNEPDAFPVAASVFANEITGSSVTPTDPSPLSTIQDVSTLTSSAMTGAGITGASFDVNQDDQNNWRLIIGGWMYYSSLPTSFEPILQIRERDGDAYRNIFGMDAAGLVFRRRSVTGPTSIFSVRHNLTSTNGLVNDTITASDLSVSFRVFSAETFFIQAEGFNGGALQGGEGHDYTVTDINTSQAETTQNFALGAGTQVLNLSYVASGNSIDGPSHVITIRADSLIAGLDEIRLDIITSPGNVTASSGNTYTDSVISDGHTASGRVMRYVISFRSINGVETGNLEAVLSFYGYDSNGNARVFDENTFDLGYPALDLQWDILRYGGASGIHQNVQGFVLAADTPLFEYPRHSTLSDYLNHYDAKTTDYCWRNIAADSQDTDYVRFPETVTMPNFFLVSPDGGRHRLLVDDLGVLSTEKIT